MYPRKYHLLNGSTTSVSEINFSPENTSTESQIVKDVEIWATCHVENLGKPISVNEIHNVAKKLKSNKASANDSVNNEIIKVWSNNLACYYAKLFNGILFSETFPKTWSEGVLLPLYTNQKTKQILATTEIHAYTCVGKFLTSIQTRA